MGIPHKVPFWLMAQPRAPPSLQSWFIRLVSVTWHWHCPLLLLWKLPVGTFTIIWSPDGRTHQTETYTYTPSYTHGTVSSHSHWACARGQVSLPLPPLWKDLSPRGLSCLVGQRGKRLCKPAKWGTGLGMHEAKPNTHTSSCFKRTETPPKTIQHLIWFMQNSNVIISTWQREGLHDFVKNYFWFHVTSYSYYLSIFYYYHLQSINLWTISVLFHSHLLSIRHALQTERAAISGTTSLL